MLVSEVAEAYNFCMKQFVSTLLANILGCFKGWMLLWHLAAIVITALLVMSGFDWWYYQATQNSELRHWMFWAARIGFLVPICLPLYLLLIGYAFKRGKVVTAAKAVIQAELIGSLISSTYKAFTGRAHPAHFPAQDISQVFQFGFLRGGVFWGWPSSHTTIAFASAFALITLFPKCRWLRVVMLAYAFYIGLGVSMTIHWFSDFVAGVIFGTVIGSVVGKSYRVSPLVA